MMKYLTFLIINYDIIYHNYIYFLLMLHNLFCNYSVTFYSFSIISVFFFIIIIKTCYVY